MYKKWFGGRGNKKTKKTFNSLRRSGEGELPHPNCEENNFFSLKNVQQKTGFQNDVHQLHQLFLFTWKMYFICAGENIRYNFEKYINFFSIFFILVIRIQWIQEIQNFTIEISLNMYTTYENSARLPVSFFFHILWFIASHE